MRRLALSATAVLSMFLLQGCFLLPDDGSGTVNLGECTGGPIAVSIPAAVYCDVVSIAATVWGTDMTTLDVTIDRNHPAATLAIPSGPDRHLLVKVFTADNPTVPAFTSDTYSFCVSDGQPVSVSVDIVALNRVPNVGAINLAAQGGLLPGVPVTLTVSAADPDACDSVQSFTWSTLFGSISGNGATAVWTPWCTSTFGICEATVAVTVQDGRGGTATAQATYTVAPLNSVADRNGPPPATSGRMAGRF